MSELKEYEVEIGGLPHTVLLDDEAAKARGLSAPKPKAATAENKSRKPSNKSGA